MVAFPAEIPVTTPLELTVANNGLTEVQGFDAAGVPEPANVVVKFTQSELFPVIEGDENCPETLKLLLLFEVHEPLFVVTV